MPKPKAYEPVKGYKYQILCRNPAYDRSWDHCDYAKDLEEKRHLIKEYRMAYGAGWEFNSYSLPFYCWPKKEAKGELSV